MSLQGAPAASRTSFRLLHAPCRQFAPGRELSPHPVGQQLSRAEAQTEVERIAKDVLTNPVIEEFRFEVLD